MDDDIKENMSYANSSKELWDELIERYGDVNAIEIYQLRKDLNAISQGNTPLVEYYSNMKRTWENLDTLDPIPTCTCGALSSCTCQLLKRILDRDTHAKLIQFLMGLNSGYEGVKTNILSMEPLPPLNKALSLLQKIERQKQISDAVDVLGEANAYAAGVEVKQPDLKKAKTDSSVDDDTEIIVPKKCTHCNKKGHSIDECFQLKTCSYCGKKGHIQSICKWYKQSRSFRGRGRGGYGRGGTARGGYTGRNANNADVMQYDDYLQDDPLMDFSSSSQINTAFNSDMVDGIVDSVVQRVMKSFGDRTSNNSVSTANFAGKYRWSNAVVNCFDTHNWIVDTGASDHMTSQLSILSNIQNLAKPLIVALPDGSIKFVYQMGRVYLTPTITLENVLVIPGFRQNLLSVSKLVENSKMTAVFTPTECVLQDHSSKTILGRARRVGDLYKLRPAAGSMFGKNKPVAGSLTGRNTSLSNCSLGHNQLVNTSRGCNVKTIDAQLIHDRLGHTSFEKLQHVIGLSKQALKKFHCETCALAKHHSLPYPRSISHAISPFDLLHADLWGPYRTVALNGASYFLTLVDDCSRSTWTFLLQNKMQVPAILRQFLNQINTQFQKNLKIFRSDNGSEFIQAQCHELFSAKGVLHQTSMAGRPQQNGRVERKHRHLVETARSLKLHAHLPAKFWGDCILAATYLINKMPTIVLDWQTPYEVLFSQKPKYEELRVFGCLCYASIPLGQSDKFAAKAKKCIMIGYPFGKKGYKVYDLETHKCFFSRDVKFQEHIFPFKSSDKDLLFNSETLQVSDDPLALVNPGDSQCLVSHRDVQIPETTPAVQTAGVPTAVSTEIPTNAVDVTNIGETPAPTTTATTADSTVRRSSRPVIPTGRLKDYQCNVKLPTRTAMTPARQALHASILTDLNQFDPKICCLNI
ncbi:uncharacterized protein LOC141638914 [Silene latifolia]|uniref:uncharacterized protein LOC141638914 n=1 Tax=Silene latifolia TaxID=37657 RepID=UPI003D772D9E